MPKIIDITGQRFGKLLVIEQAGRRRGAVLWRCKCDCDNYSVVESGSLKSGNTRSCGCLLVQAHTTHGGKYTRLYHIWTSMHQRCYNPNHDHFQHYGGKGIGIYEDWQKFESFRDWALANGYRDDLTIDRIENDKGYYPKNCHWIPRRDNTIKRNRKLTDSQIIEIKSRLLINTDMELAKEFKVGREAISKIRHGRRWGHIGIKTESSDI